MALTRKLLKGMGLTEEQVDTIIDAHTETVDGLKEDLKQAKKDAEEADDLRKQLKTAQEDLKAAEELGYPVLVRPSYVEGQARQGQEGA